MRTTVSTAVVTERGCAGQMLAPVAAVCFGAAAEPLPLVDQERELRIQAEGLLMQAEMLAWERMAAERGLPHG